MTLSQIELGCLFKAVNLTKDGKPRTFQFVELALISPLSEKLGKCVVDNQLKEPSYEVDLTSEEKVKIKGFVEEHEWQVGDAGHVISLVEKLK